MDKLAARWRRCHRGLCPSAPCTPPPSPVLPACLLSGTGCRRRDYQMEHHPKGIILGFMEFTYFYLIFLLIRFIKCALSEDFWISTPNVKHNDVTGFLKQASFCNREDRQSGRVRCLSWGWRHAALCRLLVRVYWWLSDGTYSPSFICQLSDCHCHVS